MDRSDMARELSAFREQVVALNQVVREVRDDGRAVNARVREIEQSLQRERRMVFGTWPKDYRYGICCAYV